MIISTLLSAILFYGIPYNEIPTNENKSIRFTEMILNDEIKIPKPNIWEKNIK